jgi:hypothetical protein
MSNVLCMYPFHLAQALHGFAFRLKAYSQELKQSIQAKCFSDSPDIENYTLLRSDNNQAVTAQQWPTALKGESRKIISLILKQREYILAGDSPMTRDSAMVRSTFTTRQQGNKVEDQERHQSQQLVPYGHAR